MKEIIKKETTEVIGENGEFIKKEESIIYKTKSEDSFAKLYIDNACLFSKIKSIDLLFYLINIMNYDGIVALHALNKKDIASKLQISIKTIDNKLIDLKKSGVIKPLARGVFCVNPFVSAKGKWPHVKARREIWLREAGSNSKKEKPLTNITKEQQKALDQFSEPLNIDDFE